jgi:hypothetical protein
VYNYQAPKRRRGLKALIWVAAIIVVLVGLDFGAKAFAENAAAGQIQKRGFPSKPNVSIAGFPFLTQVITRHFQQITITSSNIPAGPLRITSLTVVADNVHLSGSFQSGTAGPLHGTIVISLGSLGGALGAVGGPLATFVGGSKILTIKAVGGNEVKGSLNLAGGLVSGSAVWQVSRTGPAEISLHKVSSSGVFSSLPSDVTLPVSALPAGLTLSGGLNASASGITAHVYARSVTFGA